MCLLFVLFICMGIQTAGRELAPKKNQKGLKLEYKISVDRKNNKNFSVKAKISGIQSECIHLRMTANYGRIEQLKDLIPQIVTSSEGEEIMEHKETLKILESFGLSCQKCFAYTEKFATFIDIYKF